FDQKFTFLICQKIDFNFQGFNELYEEKSLFRHRHNMILSVEDGLFLYTSPNGHNEMWCYPSLAGEDLLTSWMIPKIHGDNYFKVFAHYMFQAVSNVTILFPDLGQYMDYL
ncbi:MAG: hypothetical protein AAFY26_04720, partial [Cyanobacteria bacterium J06638_22]